MHKVKQLQTFQQQLAYCVTQFVEKDATLANDVVAGLMKFWPATNSTKEVLFLNELEEVLDLIPPEIFSQLAPDLFKHLNRCLASPHFSVAERALYIWNNESLFGLIAQNRRVILPIIFASLTKNSTTHWNATVKQLTNGVLKLFMELDPDLVEECEAGEKVRREEELARLKRCGDGWVTVEASARAQLGGGRLPQDSAVLFVTDDSGGAAAAEVSQLLEGATQPDLKESIERTQSGGGGVDAFKRKSLLNKSGPVM